MFEENALQLEVCSPVVCRVPINTLLLVVLLHKSIRLSTIRYYKCTSHSIQYTQIDLFFQRIDTR
jgi:hypothetical protein